LFYLLLGNVLGIEECCGSGSGILCLLDLWIRDRGWGKIKIRIRDEHLGLYFRKLKNIFFGLKILKFFDADLDPGWKKFGSVIGEPRLTSRIRNTGIEYQT
jgi:hypothetical protein